MTLDRLVDLAESTYALRVVLGATFFLVLGLVDWWRHPDDPRRAKEYLFLVVAMALGVLYGVVHDHVTATISPEYFLKAKDLESDPRPFRWAVTLLAAQACYGPGLLVGAALLIANNPGARPQLSYRELFRQAGVVAAIAGTCAVLGALASGLADPLHLRKDVKFLGEPAATRFLFTWGAHAGSYLGGAVGLGVGVFRVRLVRRSRAPSVAAA